MGCRSRVRGTGGGIELEDTHKPTLYRMSHRQAASRSVRIPQLSSQEHDTSSGFTVATRQIPPVETAGDILGVHLIPSGRAMPCSDTWEMRSMSIAGVLMTFQAITLRAAPDTVWVLKPEPT